MRPPQYPRRSLYGRLMLPDQASYFEICKVLSLRTWQNHLLKKQLPWVRIATMSPPSDPVSPETDTPLAVRCVRALLERHGLPKYRQSAWIADAMGLSYAQAHRRMNGAASWTLEDLERLATPLRGIAGGGREFRRSPRLGTGADATRRLERSLRALARRGTAQSRSRQRRRGPHRRGLGGCLRERGGRPDTLCSRAASGPDRSPRSARSWRFSTTTAISPTRSAPTSGESGYDARAFYRSCRPARLRIEAAQRH